MKCNQIGLFVKRACQVCHCSAQLGRLKVGQEYDLDLIESPVPGIVTRNCNSRLTKPLHSKWGKLKIVVLPSPP